MKLREFATRLRAAVCAAVSACTVLSSFSAMSLSASAAPNYAYSNYLSASQSVYSVKSSSSSPAGLKTALSRLSSDFQSSSGQYYTIYTKNLTTNFAIVYRPTDVNLYNVLNTSGGLSWIHLYSDYLTTLRQITGLTVNYPVCVLDAGRTKDSFHSNKCMYFNRDCSVDVCAAIMNNKLTHGMMHETAHAYNPSVGYKTANQVFNSDEEVNVNLRVITALHCMGMQAVGKGYETQDKLLYDYTSSFANRTDVNAKYRKDSNVIRPLDNDKTYIYFPQNSRLREEKNRAFIVISEAQYISDKINHESVYGYWRRMGNILSFLTDRPIWYSSSYDNDANNWMNTDDLNRNFNSITESEWMKIAALCVADVTKIGGSARFAPGEVNAYKDYLKKCTFLITYNYNGTRYNVKVTPRVASWISKTCTDINGAYILSGVVIQTYNILDVLGQDLYALNINKTGTYYRTANEYYWRVFTNHTEPSHLHAYTATQV